MINALTLLSKMGPITIIERDGLITHICIGSDIISPDAVPRETPLIKEAARQLTAYFDRKLFDFDLPINPSGTSFTLRVWKCIQRVKYGQTASYKDIAIGVGSPNASRAVGIACARTPISLIIPCHRIISSNGSLSGIRGGLDQRRQLLAFEKGELL